MIDWYSTAIYKKHILWYCRTRTGVYEQPPFKGKTMQVKRSWEMGAYPTKIGLQLRATSKAMN